MRLLQKFEASITGQEWKCRHSRLEIVFTRFSEGQRYLAVLLLFGSMMLFYASVAVGSGWFSIVWMMARRMLLGALD
jgi:hypothetical protein